MASAFIATSIVSQKKEDDTTTDAFDNPPIAFTNPHAGLTEWKYTPDLTTKKSRKCSNKKYVKRKKAKNGR